MPPPSPRNQRAKEMLLQGHNYEEVAQETGVSKKALHRIVYALREAGHQLDPRTPYTKRQQTLKLMPYGRIGNILEGMSTEDLEIVSQFSYDSWEQAIETMVHDHLETLKEQKND